MSTSHPLAALIEHSNLLDANWNRHHVHLKNALPVSAFPDEAEVLHIIDLPLLRLPYFSVVKDGVWPDEEKVTRVERIDGIEITDLANPEGIRAALKGGCTLKLNQLEDWHKPTRDLVDEIGALVSAEIKSFMFYTPSDSTGLRPHRDGSHVLAVQLSGEKEWRLYAAPELIDARPDAVEVAPEAWTHKFMMEPGDVLYLPHGYPHAATAGGQESLHLTLTISEPDPVNLAEALLLTFCEDDKVPMRAHSMATATESADAVRRALLAQIDKVSPERLLEVALRNMRTRAA